MTYFLDTNICIYYLKGMYPDIVTHLNGFRPSDVKIPSIVAAELFYGARKSAKSEENLQRIGEFLMPFEVIPFGAPAAALYGTLRADLEREGKIIGPNDLIIASTVLAESGILVTHNTEEFARVPDLSLEDWTVGQVHCTSEPRLI